MSKDRPLKRVWGYEDTLCDLKAKAAKNNMALKDYLDVLTNVELPRNNEKKKMFLKFP